MSFPRAGAGLLGVLLFVCAPLQIFAQYSSPDDSATPIVAAPQQPASQGGDLPLPEPVSFDEFSPLRTALQDTDPTNSDDVPGTDLRAQLQQLQEQFNAFQNKQSGPKAKTYPNVTANGFFQADYAWFNQDAANVKELGSIQDGFDFRRVRLNMRGDVAENVEYVSEMDFAASGRPSFRDVAMTVRNDFPVIGNFKIGYWRMPFGMDALTSARNFPLLERGLTQTFVPFRQIGMGTFGANEDQSATYAVAMYRFPTDVYGGNLGDAGGYGMAGRVTWLPLGGDVDSNYLIHLGADYSFSNPTTNSIQLRTTNELSQSAGGTLPGQLAATPYFVDTGLMPARNQNLFGLEAAGRVGALWTQHEVMWAQINQTNAPVVTFPALSSEVGYLLTKGDRREYDKAPAVFGGIKPLHPLGRDGWGALEIVSRVSYIDLNNQNIHGGRLTDLSTGLNWYLNQYAKLQFVHIHSFLNRRPTGASDCDSIVMRVMVSFY